MRRRIAILTLLASVPTIVATITGCPAITPNPAGSGGTGSVHVLITDKPFPFEFLTEATVTITRVEVRRAGDDDSNDNAGNDNANDNDAGNSNDNNNENENENANENQNDNGADNANDNGDGDGDDDGPFVTIFEGEKEFNLLDLRNGRTDLLGDADVPAGTYTQMRLIVTAGRVVLTDDREFPLDVPSGDTSGIKLNFTFTVEDGEETALLLDVDLSRAFQATPSGHIDDVETIREFKFRPSLAMRLINLLEAGQIQGLVTDNASAPLAGVAVTAFDDEDNEVTTTTTGSDGAYTMLGLPTGTYRVEFSLSGYADGELTGVEVQAGETTAGVNAALEPAP